MGFNPAVAEIMYRHAAAWPEALTPTIEPRQTACRHEAASEKRIIEKLPGAVRMLIEDEGKAFDAEHMWEVGETRRRRMLRMSARMEMVGGTISVESAPRKGIAISAQIPFRSELKSQGR